MLAAMVHVSSQNFLEGSLRVRSSNQSWFDMADKESLPSPLLSQPHMRRHGAKTLACRFALLVRVNGVSVSQIIAAVLKMLILE